VSGDGLGGGLSDMPRPDRGAGAKRPPRGGGSGAAKPLGGLAI